MRSSRDEPDGGCEAASALSWVGHEIGAGLPCPHMMMDATRLVRLSGRRGVIVIAVPVHGDGRAPLAMAPFPGSDAARDRHGSASPQTCPGGFDGPDPSAR
jgi:hypothetical protein